MSILWGEIQKGLIHCLGNRHTHYQYPYHIYNRVNRASKYALAIKKLNISLKTEAHREFLVRNYKARV